MHRQIRRRSNIEQANNFRINVNDINNDKLLIAHSSRASSHDK